MDSEGRLFRVVVCGNVSVGKTTIIDALLFGLGMRSEQTLNTKTTIGMDMHTVRSGLDRFTVIDLTGNERTANSVASVVWRNAHVIVFVYDVTNVESFMAAEQWIGTGLRYTDNPYVAVIGNKIDLRGRGDCVQTETGQHMCEKYNYWFRECCGRDATSVKRAFMQLFDEVKIRNKSAMHNDKATPTITLGQSIACKETSVQQKTNTCTC